MTATTTTTATAAAPVATRTRVGWGDLVWLTWRQHRWTILGTTAVVVGIAVAALAIALRVDAAGSDDLELFGRWRFVGLGQLLVMAPMAIGAVIAVFWAAPLLSREYEQRTHLVVWSQDITSTRWLTGKVVLLGVAAVVPAVVLGMASIKLMNSINAVTLGYLPFRPFDPPAFEAAPQVQFGFAAFGFALGLALSAITRRTVLSMGLTLGAFVVTRGVVAGVWRPYFTEPVHQVEPYSRYEWTPDQEDIWTVDSGFADAAGNAIPFPQVCSSANEQVDYAKCMADNDVHFFSDFHPIDRLVPFQWFEAGIFTVLAAGLLVLAFTWVRRARRV